MKPDILFPGIFGIMKTPDSEAGAGLPVLALGIDGVTQCMVVPNLPSTNLKKPGPLVLHGETIYVFGGSAVTPNLHSSAKVYQYDLHTGDWNQMSKMIQKRTNSGVIRFSENEVFITGILFQSHLLSSKLRMADLITLVFVRTSALNNIFRNTIHDFFDS